MSWHAAFIDKAAQGMDPWLCQMAHDAVDLSKLQASIRFQLLATIVCAKRGACSGHRARRITVTFVVVANLQMFLSLAAALSFDAWLTVVRYELRCESAFSSSV
jgi:hypothetical protein